ncbi:3'-5' exonuclease [Prevotella sp. E2-28]|jgi:ribonuclease D|uniref:3'-5' exonuclease n=1 Tax=Prevotella sp. E2-28 TaxID=2913620 RepID=UPI001EDC78EF|nr:3'-5' exonuclease [Prevotella sp. E2-28]UKK54749.1 3'-5' exonuclease domain-containing protein 2 [Prevotella sp. E2-28]
MLKTIYNKYDKSLISSLPVAQFQGKIIVILTKGEAERAVRYLLSQPILGFDTETRPSFKKGHQHKVSLLQVSTPDICFLFRLNYTGLTDALVELLEDETVLKIGLSWHDDINALHKLKDFKTGRFVDIQDLVREIGIEDLSLQKLFANLFGQKISKRQQLSNWEADVLLDKQKAYAATDAWACIEIYNEIIRLKESKDYNLIIKEEDNNEANISEKR